MAGGLTTACAARLLPLLLLALPAAAPAQFQLAYTINNGAVTITGDNGYSDIGALFIPGAINGLPVTSIWQGAFDDCWGLTSVTIPNSVTNIGDSAFGDCCSLASVTIGNGVTSIGYQAFYGCPGLTNVAMGDSVTSIGDSAFESCDLTSVTIPGSVTSIGDNAFQGCSGLASVMIPNSVTNIGEWAFFDCASLMAITVDALNAFYTSVNGVLFDRGVAALIEYPEGKTGGYALPNSVTSIGDYAFGGCTGLASVAIGTNVTTIGDWAFWNCTGLASVMIPNSVTSIGGEAFLGCSSLTNVTIPNSVTSIGVGVVNDCINLASVTIPDSVTSIGDNAFEFCRSLTSVTIPNSVTNIGDSAFAYCTSLSSVYFQGNAPSADSSVFANDNNVTVYYLPGTTGWGLTFGGRPTMPLPTPPSIVTPPQTQTAEMGSVAGFWVEVTNTVPVATYYQWSFSGTNVVGGTNSCLVLTNAQPDQAGAYTVVVANHYGAVTSAPALLSVIPPVERSVVPALYLTGDVGSFLHLDYVKAFGPGASWLSLSNFMLLSTPQLYLDLSEPLPAQRFYRAWQTNTPSARPVLDPRLATEIPLTGAIGSSVQIDYINQFGPTNAWVTLDTVVLTNTAQLYFDVTMFRQPTRLYRLVASP